MVTVTIEIEGTKQTRELHSRMTVIGRSRSADIRLVHPRISGRHARIEIAEDGTAILVDAGSKNGLLVGESRVNRVTVTEGLAVTIGPALFKFKTGGGQARAECLQRLQLPDPGVTGISPPPAPGSGLGTTRRDFANGEVALGERSESKGHSPAAALLAELSKQAAKPAEPAPVSLEIAPPPPLSPLAPVVLEPKRSRHGRRTPFTLAGLVSAASTAGSLALAIGLHVFIAAVLSVCVYRTYSKPESIPLKLTLSPPKSLFVPPPDVWKGEGAGMPDGTREEPKFGKRPPAPEPGETETTPEFAADALPASDPLASTTPRVSSAPRPAMALSKRGAMKKVVKVELVPDNGTWEPGKPADGGPVAGPEAGGAANPPIDIKPDSDPAELVRGNLQRGQQGGWKTVATMEAGEIAVVTGDYDTVQRVLDKLKVRYTTIEPAKFGGAKLSSVRVLILNCPGNLDGSGILKLRDYVNKGGWVVSTDWALSPIKEAFPGYLRNVTLSPETWVKIGAAEGAKDDPLLTDVFNFNGDTPKWYLEERSYLFQVDAKSKDKVKVLIESAEMKKKWNTGCVAATFEYGRGRVLHIVSHLQQVSTDPKSHYSMYQFLANWLIQAAAATETVEPKKK